MSIRVKLFATIAEMAGTREVILESAGHADAGSIFAHLIREYPSLESRRGTILFAVNSEFARPETPVHDGDEIAFFPPVSGG
jgi:molybdopterin converting factor subunit 1